MLDAKKDYENPLSPQSEAAAAGAPARGAKMLSVNNIYKNFGDLKVLKGVSTEIRKGEVVSIIGVSGSGKSTLLRCMNLLETPTFGEVWMEGKLLTPPDPYLHPEIIRASKTYGRLIEDGMNDEDAIALIKSEDLLKEKHSAEGKDYRRLMKEIKRENGIDVREVGIVLAGLARIGAQPFDAQIRESEAFDLGDVDSGITVDEVGGRAVRLVAGDGTVAVGPGRPLVGEVLEEHVAECLAVVADDFRIALLQEREIVLQLIAAPLLELL